MRMSERTVGEMERVGPTQRAVLISLLCFYFYTFILNAEESQLVRSSFPIYYLEDNISQTVWD